MLDLLLNKKKARVAALAKSAEEASTKLQNIQEGKANFDSVYEQYKKGQASSSELEDAAKTLNDTLNDQSLVVQSLAGNWEAYSQSVDAAAKKAQAQQNTLKQNSWEAERSYATKASSWDTLVGPKIIVYLQNANGRRRSKHLSQSKCNR